MISLKTKCIPMITLIGIITHLLMFVTCISESQETTFNNIYFMLIIIDILLP